MKSWNFKHFLNFFKEFWVFFAYGLWTFILGLTLVPKSLVPIPIYMRLCFIAILVLSAIAVLNYADKLTDKHLKQQEEAKNKRLQELKVQDKYYIDLVNKHVNEKMNKFKDKSQNFNIDTSLEYLIYFSDEVNRISQTKIEGKPDSFILASCLMYSLISRPVITIPSKDSEYVKYHILAINIDIAMNCVFEIISEPITYSEKNGVWLEEKHPKVNISIQNGIIKDSDLCLRIFNTVYHDELSKKRTSIMQFSNLLYLIYLNCQ